MSFTARYNHSWLTAVALLLGCGAAIPPVPSKGGPGWLELSTEHFTVWTDGGEARGRELLRHFENLLQVVIGTIFPTYRGSNRAFVIALRDDRELHAYIREEFGGMAAPATG